mmetsp:Transcript_6513/g.13070  ORF Transcript_6513/g.13070 Transcript_6513/m.13070 type:complete len:321 (-) Transcript_6513:673-1635(-)
MNYLSRSDRLQRRRNLETILPGARSVIVSTMFYWPGPSKLREQASQALSARGVISCYAWGPDYHDIFQARLAQLAIAIHREAGGSSKWYVDTGAVMERDLGERAGLGFVGKNTMLINERFGSGFFLGEIISTLMLPPDPKRIKTGGCGKCVKCLQACPTNAFLPGGYGMDARRCISYLTIEHKGSIPKELRPLLGGRIYGCDDCQVVCPWNKFEWEGDQSGASPMFGSPDIHVTSPQLLLVLSMDEESFVAHFGGTAILRIGLARLKRNAAVALGNVGTLEHIRPLQEFIAREEDDMVREHMQWAEGCISERVSHVTLAS